jgi:hypothetical protein
MTIMYWTTKTRMITVMAATILVAGCAGGTEVQFGDAVRDMTEKQIHNLVAAYNPDPEAPEGGNPDRLNEVVDAHRNNAEDLTEDRGALIMRPFN